MAIFFKTLLILLFTQLTISKDFISIKDITNKANLRKGPGDWYPVKWIIETPGLPLKVLERSDRFHKVELHDGTQGWLSMILTTKKNNLILLGDALLKNKNGKVKAKVLKHNIIKDFDCKLDKKPNVCKVTIQSYKGYISKKSLWGF